MINLAAPFYIYFGCSLHPIVRVTNLGHAHPILAPSLHPSVRVTNLGHTHPILAVLSTLLSELQI